MQHNCPRVQISAVSLSKFGTCVQSVNRELGRGGEAQKLLFPASSLFDKIVRQQKEKKKQERIQSVVLVFCSFLSCVRNESGTEKKKRKVKPAQSNCCPSFAKIGVRQSMKVIAS